MADPRLPRAIIHAALPGFVATILATGLALALLGAIDPTGSGETKLGRLLRQIANAIVALPHAALALGLAFLLAPGGWLARGLAAFGGPEIVPAGFGLAHDPSGSALILALVLKETPFLIVIGAIALGQMPVRSFLALGAALGYRRPMAWTKLILPELYRRLRLPILAVLAYSLSVVDMSLILGPDLPPSLPVLILTWMRDADLAWRAVAASGALLHLGLVLLAISIWLGGEWAIARLLRPWLVAGGRAWPPVVAAIGRLGLNAALLLLMLLPLGSAAALGLWSLTGAWHFPAFLPQDFSLAAWQRALDGIGQPLGISLGIAAMATAIALGLAVFCLERERDLAPAQIARGEFPLYLPLLLPDICFLFGLQILLFRLGLDGTWFGLVWCHLLFVFPYVFLALRDSWRALDPRYERIAAGLGAGPWRRLVFIRLGLLRPHLALAAAIGMAVSLSLYLPSVIAGAGRWPTLATEAIALASGGDRRIVGVYASLQMGLVMIALLGAHRLGRPRWSRG